MTITSVITIQAKARKISELSTIKFSHKITTANSEDYVSQPLFKLPEDYNHLEFFNFDKSFKNAQTFLGWSTGPKLFTNLRMLLSDCATAEDAFESEADLAATETVATFTTAYAGFYSAMLSELHHDDQLEYMRTINLPNDMSVREFLQKLKTLNSLAKRFPDAPPNNPGLTDTELKRCFHHAMPVYWQRNYSVAGYRYASQSLHDIYEYMVTQEQAKPLPLPPPRTGNIGNFRRPRATSTPAATAATNNTTPAATPDAAQQEDQPRRRNRIRPEDPCPLPGHGNHDWYHCRMNAQGLHNSNSHRPTSQAAASTPPSVASTSNSSIPASTTSNAEVHYYDLDIDTIAFAEAADALEAENY